MPLGFIIRTYKKVGFGSGRYVIIFKYGIVNTVQYILILCCV